MGNGGWKNVRDPPDQAEGKHQIDGIDQIDQID